MPRHGKKINYDQAFLLYCTPKDDGRLRSVADVAEAIGSSTGWLERVAAKHEWVKRRDDIREKRQRVAELSLIEQVDTVNKDQFEKWDKVEKFAMSLFDEQIGLFNGEIQETKAKKRSLYAVEVATNTLKEASKMKRVILLLPTEVSKADVTNLNKNVELPKDQIDEMDAFVKKNGAPLELAPKSVPENPETETPTPDANAQPSPTH